MSYNINYEDLRNMNNTLASNLGSWKTSLTNISTPLTNMLSDDVMQGEAATKMKNYISEVQLVLIDSLKNMMTEYTAKFLLYMQGFYEFEDAIYAKLNYTEMSYLKTQFNLISEFISAKHEIATIVMSTVNDLHQSSIADVENYIATIEQAKADVISYYETIGEYDNLYATTNLDNIRETVSYLRTCIDRVKSDGKISVLEYETGSYISIEEQKKLYECMVRSQNYITEHEAEITAAYEYQKDVWDDIEDDMAEDRRNAGFIKIFECVLTTACVVASVALSGPAAPYVAIASAPLLGYVRSNAVEGVQDVYYGLQGDPYTEAFNPICDTIFRGNRDLYDMYGLVADSIFTLAVPLSQAKTAYSIGSKLVIGKLSVNTSTVILAEAAAEEVVTNKIFEICQEEEVDYITTLAITTAAGAMIGKITIDSSIDFGNNKINVDVPVSSTGKVTRTLDSVDEAFEGGTGSKFQDVFDLADNYNLSDDTFNNHILDRHGPNSTYGNKSHFNADFDIKDGIDSTLRGDNFVVGPNTAGREGYIFEQTFTNPIGTNSKGKPLYTLKVVIDEDGNVITAFPKK